MGLLGLGRKSDPKAKLRKVLGEYNLPSFPGAVMQVLQAIRDPNSSAASVAEVLAVDPGLSVRVLRIANSPVFSPVRKVENLAQAVALVGLTELESLVLSMSVRGNLPKASAEGYDFARFWRASARRGFVARALAGILCPARESESFTAGLLQDMALPFLAHQRSDEYGPVLKQWHSSEVRLYELERDTFGWDHAEVGAWICGEWNLPESIVIDIGSHHPGSDREGCPASVALAAHLREADEETGLGSLIEAATAEHRIGPEKLDEIVETAFRKAEEFTQLLG
jgi:HD-like signal output (HDOD) protein